MPGEISKQLCCVKYSLMACNAFGIMMGIFVVLFGLSYPEEKFPGGYRGKETAGISGFFIIFTLIGYYGAHRQKVYFLVPYSIIIFLFLGGNLVMWGVKPEESVLDPDSNAVLILTGVFLVLMVFALWLAWQEKKKTEMGNVHVTSTAGIPLQQLTTPTTNMGQLSSTSLTTAGPITQQPQPLSQQQQLLMQHQQQLLSQQQSATSPLLAGGSATGGYYGYPYPPHPIPFDLNSKSNLPYPSPMSVFYQPGSNSYVTLPASRYKGTSGSYGTMY